MSDNIELVGTLIVLTITTLIATKVIEIPYAITYNSNSSIVFVIISLVAFAVYPAVGLALFLLTAVIFFKRNLTNSVGSILSNKDVYGIDSIRDKNIRKAYPHTSLSSGPRPYGQFEETDASNPMIGPVKEGFEPAPYGDESGSPVDGQYPKEVPRFDTSPEIKNTYYYRPEEDTGSNEFKRFGPYMDQKISAFSY
jgi:hypothetical protein